MSSAGGGEFYRRLAGQLLLLEIEDFLAPAKKGRDGDVRIASAVYL